MYKSHVIHFTFRIKENSEHLFEVRTEGTFIGIAAHKFIELQVNV